MERCPDCPAAGRCVVEWTRHMPFCGWAKRGGVHRERVRELSEAGTAERPASTPQSDSRPPAPAKELVVCRYREDVAWLDGVPGEFFVSLYDKSGEPFEVARQARVERLANVGREAHSMLWHIVRYFDALADWTYFVQGDAPYHAPDILGRLTVEYDDLCPLTRTYSPDHPSAEIKAKDRVEHVGGFEVRYGDARAQIYGTDRPWFNVHAWEWVFAGPCPSPLRFGYGAMYAVPRRRITARPRSFWSWLLREAERSPWKADEHTDPPLTPWQIEALWLYLFADPADHPHRDHVAESLEMTRRMNACPSRSTEGCGCSGGKCAARGGAIVSHIDCFACLRENP